MTTHTETMWAIAGKKGLYRSMGATEKAVIYAHCKAFLPNTKSAYDQFWLMCRADGDRAVEVIITYEYPE